MMRIGAKPPRDADGGEARQFGPSEGHEARGHQHAADAQLVDAVDGDDADLLFAIGYDAEDGVGGGCEQGAADRKHVRGQFAEARRTTMRTPTKLRAISTQRVATTFSLRDQDGQQGEEQRRGKASE